MISPSFFSIYSKIIAEHKDGQAVHDIHAVGVPIKLEDNGENINRSEPIVHPGQLVALPEAGEATPVLAREEPLDIPTVGTISFRYEGESEQGDDAATNVAELFDRVRQTDEDIRDVLESIRQLAMFRELPHEGGGAIDLPPRRQVEEERRRLVGWQGMPPAIPLLDDATPPVNVIVVPQLDHHPDIGLRVMRNTAHNNTMDSGIFRTKESASANFKREMDEFCRIQLHAPLMVHMATVQEQTAVGYDVMVVTLLFVSLSNTLLEPNDRFYYEMTIHSTMDMDEILVMIQMICSQATHYYNGAITALITDVALGNQEQKMCEFLDGSVFEAKELSGLGFPYFTGEGYPLNFVYSLQGGLDHDTIKNERVHV